MDALPTFPVLSENAVFSLFFSSQLRSNSAFRAIDWYDFRFLYEIHQLAEANGRSTVYLTELANSMGLPIEEISKAVQHLQQKGMVTWATDVNKGRTYIELTSHAFSAVEKQHERLSRIHQKITQNIDPAELQAMASTLEKISKIIQSDQANQTSSDS